MKKYECWMTKKGKWSQVRFAGVGILFSFIIRSHFICRNATAQGLPLKITWIIQEIFRYQPSISIPRARSLDCLLICLSEHGTRIKCERTKKKSKSVALPSAGHQNAKPFTFAYNLTILLQASELIHKSAYTMHTHTHYLYTNTQTKQQVNLVTLSSIDAFCIYSCAYHLCLIMHSTACRRIAIDIDVAIAFHSRAKSFIHATTKQWYLRNKINKDLVICFRNTDEDVDYEKEHEEKERKNLTRKIKAEKIRSRN